MGALGVQWGPPDCQGKFPGGRIGPPGPHFGSGGTPNGVPEGPLGLSGVANAKSETSGWKNRTRGMEEESRARGAAGRGAHPGKLQPPREFTNPKQMWRAGSALGPETRRTGARGQGGRRAPDGIYRSSGKHLDGKIVQNNPDGTEQTRFPDGSRVRNQSPVLACLLH